VGVGKSTEAQIKQQEDELFNTRMDLMNTDTEIENLKQELEKFKRLYTKAMSAQGYLVKTKHKRKQV
jgi:chromosome segregation ATPase